MAEESEISASEGLDPVALSLALSGASRAEADAFLRDQRHHLHEQLKQIHLDIWEKWLGVLLRLATLCVGIAAAGGIALMVWQAKQSNGLLIEPFSVPPGMAEKGLTGEVVASQMLDKLAMMDAGTTSTRSPRSYANNWGKDIKVEIPETGVSIGEFRRFLREWLGNDIHISGEVWHTEDGLAVSARTGGERGETFTGPQSDLDALVQKAAEHVYGQTQPYRYASYIRNQRRFDEARAVYLRLTESDSPLEKGWAWQGLATLPNVTHSRNRNTAWIFRKAVSVYPDYILGHISLATTELNLGHDEAALAETQIAWDLLNRSSIPDIDPVFVPIMRKSTGTRLPFLLCDYSQAIAVAQSSLELPDQAGLKEGIQVILATALAFQHDIAAARLSWRQLPSQGNIPRPILLARAARRAVARMRIEAASEDWQDVLASQADTELAIDAADKTQAQGPTFDPADIRLKDVAPLVALAKAKTGDFAGAEAAIAAAPGDCYACLRTRGMIASEARQWGRANYWFGRAVAAAPSIPVAYANWGQSLLVRGQPGQAIEKFTLANDKDPHFADALEGWGEALMAQKNPGAALAKFEEAEKYAPRWGRLHLKWGEALAAAGRQDEAGKHFAMAGGLDLLSPEKDELAKASHG